MLHTESHYILQGVRAGAKGVVLKTHASEDLVRAIREASRGGTYTLIWRNVATSLVVFPSAINWRTCRSLGLRGSGRSSVFPANLTNFLSTCCALARSTRFPFTSTASPPAPLAIGKAPSASVESIEPRPPRPCESEDRKSGEGKTDANLTHFF